MFWFKCRILFYRSYFYLEKWLAVAVAAQVAGFLFVFDYQDLAGPSDFHYLRVYFSARDIRSADSRIFAVVHEKHFVKGNLVPFLILVFGTLDFLNRKHASLGDLVLFASCLDNRKFIFAQHFIHTGPYYKKLSKKASVWYNIGMQQKSIEKYFFFGLLLATLVFTFFVFRPFWITIILGMSFAIVLHPIYEWFERRKLPNWFSALITVLLFVIVLCGPLLGIGVLVFNQSQNVYRVVVEDQGVKPFMATVDNTINRILPAGVTIDVNEKAASFVSYVSGNITKIFSATVSAFFSFILMLLIIFYFLKDGARWRKAVVVISPLADKDDEKIIRRLKLAVNGVIKGSLFIAVIQGTLMGIGLWIFGIPNPALWGVVAAVCAMIPSIGTALVSVPAIIYLFNSGNTMPAIGLLVWATVAVGLIDNFLSPYIVGSKINIPPLLILFSVLGGIAFLGPVGILMGPLSVSLLYTLISIYRNEFKDNAIL